MQKQQVRQAELVGERLQHVGQQRQRLGIAAGQRERLRQSGRRERLIDVDVAAGRAAGRPPSREQLSPTDGTFATLADAGSGLSVTLPFTINGTSVSAVPEPASLSLMLAGGVALLGLARRRRMR